MMAALQRLQPIDLLKIYGNIEYEWDLIQDRIEWQGPFNRLFSPEIPLVEGSCFGHIMTPKNLAIRGEALHETFVHRQKQYSCLYHLCLPDYEQPLVFEEGEMVLMGEMPVRLKGYIRFVDPENFRDTQINTPSEYFSGYDHETGLPGRQLMFENLASVVEQATQSGIPGAYISLAVDRTGFFTVRYGPALIREIYRALAANIRANIRISDVLGRTSSTCLGMILPECDREGVRKVAFRLESLIREKGFSCPERGEIPFQVSVGGALFPTQDTGPRKLMEQAEKNLFDGQSMKGEGALVSSVPFDLPRLIPRYKRKENRTQLFERRVCDQ